MRVSSRAFTVSARQLEAAVTTRDEFKTPTKTGDSVPTEIGQAPNRVEVWSRNQKPRATAMTGPRFEQTDFEVQVRWNLTGSPAQGESKKPEKLTSIRSPNRSPPWR